MTLSERIEAFSELGRQLPEQKNRFKLSNSNTWFTPENIEYSINEIVCTLQIESLNRWILAYPKLLKTKNPLQIGVILAGNIPLVGFHDFLSVLISGNIFVGKLSSKDDILLRIFAELLTEIEPRFKDCIRFENERLSGFDAVIATGSNNSARYFEYYFEKVPHIIRKNRNGIAVLTGNETPQQLENLSDDIFLYFGLGCRNVSKLFLPENFDLARIFEAAEKYKDITFHNKYSNNYGYNRSIFLMNSHTFWDNGFLLLTESNNYSSPVSVVFFTRYADIDILKNQLIAEQDQIQCIVSDKSLFTNAVDFGKSQRPELWDYADGSDTLHFLTNL
jgi:hypothetical protein